MKTLLTLTALFTSLSVLAANTEKKEYLIHNKDVKTTVHLNDKTVRCSALGYGVSELKISVPALDYLAFFDHSNIGESEPCMTAGMCTFRNTGDGNRVSDILDPNKPSEEIEINMILKEVYYINHDQKSCSRAIEESLKSDLRGKTFTHFRSKSLGDYPYSLCVQI